MYDRNEAAEKVGLSPITLTNYSRSGYSDLVRGMDYFVRSWQQGPHYRRKLFFTERGMQRLALKKYRVYRPGPLSASQRRFIARMDATVRLPRREDRASRIPSNEHPLTANRAVRDRLAQVMREYLVHPCAMPGCSCITHRLGLPTMEQLYAAGYLAAHLPAGSKRVR
jgi:hypothetical protein